MSYHPKCHRAYLFKINLPGVNEEFVGIRGTPSLRKARDWYETLKGLGFNVEIGFRNGNHTTPGIQSRLERKVKK